MKRVRRQLRGVAWQAPTSGFRMLAMNVFTCYLACLQEPSAFDIAGIAFLIRASNCLLIRQSALVRESLSRFQRSRCFGPCPRPPHIRRTQRPGTPLRRERAQNAPLLDILETTVFLAVIPCRDLRRKNRYEGRTTIAVQIVSEDRGAATVVAIEVLLKGFAGACNQRYLQLWSGAA